VTTIRINGEKFEWDGTRKPMSEALAIENGLGMRYADWETELAAGSMKAMCGFVWLIWRRDGRDVKLADILSGDVEIDLAELLECLAELAEEAKAAEAPDPTSGAPEPTAPDGSAGTGGATSASSPASSGSARGRSASSTSRTSKH
jgi:hypothetical protein